MARPSPNPGDVGRERQESWGAWLDGDIAQDGTGCNEVARIEHQKAAPTLRKNRKQGSPIAVRRRPAASHRRALFDAPFIASFRPERLDRIERCSLTRRNDRRDEADEDGRQDDENEIRPQQDAKRHI